MNYFIKDIREMPTEKIVQLIDQEKSALAKYSNTYTMYHIKNLSRLEKVLDERN